MRFIYAFKQSLFVLFSALTMLAYVVMAQPKENDRPMQIDSTLFVAFGGGGNSGIVLGEKAVVVIDTKMSKASDSLYMFAKANAGTKPIMVINTHYHPDHTRGNKFYDGSEIYIGSYEKDFLKKNVEPENQPTKFVKDSLTLDLGNEQVHLYNLGQAHTLNDLIVYLPSHHVVFTGDLIFNHINPVLMKPSGASVQKWISALEFMLKRWGTSTFVPGHGLIGDKTIVAAMIEYFSDMTSAEADTAREKVMLEKYKNWVLLPNMTSPEKTIDYIRTSKGTK
jgi:cyclase